eukprot:TRINITY_DN368_c0_g1_i2.p1 TRINITY_DN368_c0_g1~~TRINITY_DN368_c0_g1_i2.p1  ORF type:complete len:155 (-),score=28.35 TRINITY_DN368_c0_g1_i2:58-522(-)
MENPKIVEPNQTTETTNLKPQDSNPNNPSNPTTPREIQLPPIISEAEVLNAIEQNAKLCASNLTSLMTNLRTSLQEVSSISVQYMKVYKVTVDNLADAVSQSVVSMHDLITKGQELNTDLKKVESLHKKIKDIKKMLDTLENMITRLNVQGGKI